MRPLRELVDAILELRALQVVEHNPNNPITTEQLMEVSRAFGRVIGLSTYVADDSAFALFMNDILDALNKILETDDPDEKAAAWEEGQSSSLKLMEAAISDLQALSTPPSLRGTLRAKTKSRSQYGAEQANRGRA